MSINAVQICPSKSTYTYDFSEPICGDVEVQCSGEVKCRQAKAALVGLLTCKAKSVQLVNLPLTLQKPDVLPKGLSRLPFRFVLQEDPMQSYEGCAVNITYEIVVELLSTSRFGTKTYKQRCEVWVRCTTDCRQRMPMPVSFRMDQDGLRSKALVATSTFERFVQNVGEFALTGVIDSVELCHATQFTGTLTIEKCDVALKSVELQLCNTEVFPDANGNPTQTSAVVVTNEIVHGNPCRGLAIAMQLQLPSVRSCPTIKWSPFSVEWEVHVVVYFEEYPPVYEKFPIIIKPHSANCKKMLMTA